VKRWILTAWAVIVLAAALAPLPADTLQDIDKAVTELGAFVRRTLPDEEGASVAVMPFGSDRLGRVLLGERLRTELELNLAVSYSRTRVVTRSEGLRTWTVAGEIQSYPGTVRVVCRVSRPDGSLAGGSRADIPSSPELESLLQPARTPEPAGSPGGQGLHSEPSGPGYAAPGSAEDELEPDDIPGFEVEVPEGEIQIYTRAITQGDVDRFRFYVPSEMSVILELDTSIDLQLLLFREGENVPFQVGGGRPSEGLKLTVNLTPGYYVVEVLAYDFNVNGRYSLAFDLSGRSNDTFEPDDRLEEARQILPGDRQERVLLPGDEDWVELSFTVPGFYGVYTEGLQTDTRIEVYEEGGRLITTDEDSGSAGNAYAAVFLGVRRAYARVTGKGSLDRGSYTLVFEKVEPAQVYPAPQAQIFPIRSTPTLLQPRILQAGRYLVQVLPRRGSSAAPGEPGSIKLFAVPAMRELSGESSVFALPSGDYLLVVSPPEGAEAFSLCLVPESQAESCRRSAGG
jgi:hypothetical protein